MPKAASEIWKRRRVPAVEVTTRGYLSKRFYIGSILAGGILGMAGLSTEAPVLANLGPYILIYAGVAFLVLWYKAWAAIQDGYARTTPGKAIGFLFIPVVSFYWIFEAVWGFAKDYNSYVKRNKLLIPTLSSRVFLAASFLYLVVCSLGMAIGIAGSSTLIGPLLELTAVILLITAFAVSVLLVKKVCNAVNTLRDLREIREPNRR